MFKKIYILKFLFVFFTILIFFYFIYYRFILLETIIIPQIIQEHQGVAKLYHKIIYEGPSNQINKNDSRNEINKDFFYNFYKINSLVKSLNFLKIIIYLPGDRKLVESNDLNIYYTQRENLSLWRRFFFLRNHLCLSITNNCKGSLNYSKLLNSAFKGKSIYSLGFNVNFHNRNTNESIICSNIFTSYIPIINKNNTVDSVIVITSDISNIDSQLDSLEMKIICSYLFVGCFFSLITFYMNRLWIKNTKKQMSENSTLRLQLKKAKAESTGKSEFLANISHELRTPLNSIIGFSEMISKDSDSISNKQYVGYINDIHESGKHLLSLINDLLDFSKAESGKLTIELINTNLKKLVISSTNILKPKIEEKNINLEIQMLDEDAVINVDPRRLKQVIINILSNAIKFTDENKKITIRISKKDSKIYTIISDTGIGMATEDIPKALSTFEQIDNKSNRKYSGTGIGLPLSKKLVELMNGIFDITSKLNKGTDIIIIFDEVKLSAE